MTKKQHKSKSSLFEYFILSGYADHNVCQCEKF